MADLLGSALKFLGSAPVFGAATGNLLAGFNQRAERRWQEDMYNKYNSPSALVRQYEEAGINPALMFGGQTPAMSSSTSATPVDMSSFGSLPEMLGQLMNLKLLGTEQEGKELENEKRRQDIRSSELDNQIKSEFGLLTAKANYDEILKRLDKLQSETDLNEYERKVIGPLREALTKAQKRGLNASAFLDEWRGEYMRKYHSDPDADPLKQALTDLIQDLNPNGIDETRAKRRARRARRQKESVEYRASEITD